MSVCLQEKLNDPVVKHMRLNPPRLHMDLTVGEALAEIRRHPPEGRIIYFYAVDSENRLAGVIPTRRLLLAPSEQPLREIMVRQVVAIPDSATVLDACEFFTMHKLLAFPVVDKQRHLLGMVDVDLYTEEVHELESVGASDQLFQLIGVTAAQARRASVFDAFRYRLPWLGCNLASGIGAAFLAAQYESVLAEVVALAAFIPVVLALAESVAMQSVTLSLQVLHGQRPTWASLLLKLRRELVTGLLLGATTGALVALVSFWWDPYGRVAVTLLGGIAGGVTLSAVLGMSLPFLLRLLRRDPQVASGPIALAGADLVTLLF
ncbi:MAG: magnesium transporter [Gemmatales bacterium]|nr:magnesium transporter [Gemmatales bacterium]MDW8386937.1 magnesium transporter [Gemmatales bacterium]